MSKRILHVVKWYPHPGDPQNGVFVEKHIRSAGGTHEVLGFLNFKGQPIETSDVKLYGAEGMSPVAKLSVFIAKLANYQPDLIHFHCYANDLVPMAWWASRQGVPYLHSEHWSGLLPENVDRIKGLKRRLMRYYYARAHTVLPVSSILADGVRMVSPLARVSVLPNIVEAAHSERAEKRQYTSFCVVADVVFDIKRQDVILQTFLQLDPTQFELHFYGGGPDLEALRSRTAHLAHVFIHGRKTNAEILRALPSHDALILFSRYETFGITVFEARNAGLWAIARNTFGGAPWFDKGCLQANDDGELLDQMKTVAQLGPAPKGQFDDLNSEVIGNRLNSLYKGLN